MDEKGKKKLYERIEKETGVLSKPTATKEFYKIIANGFPKKLFDIWCVDCMNQYNDIRWAKIWTDHVKAQAYDTLIGPDVENEPEVEEKKQEEIPLIGDGGN